MACEIIKLNKIGKQRTSLSI